MSELKLTALATAGVSCAMVAVFYFLWIYCPMRHRGKWRDERRMTAHIQSCIVVSGILVVLAYFYAQVLFPDDTDAAGFASVVWAAGLHEAELMLFLLIRFYKESRRKYFRLASSALGVAGIGQLFLALHWLDLFPMFTRIVWLCFGLSLTILAGDEIWFLALNNWRFRPSNPK